MVTSHSIKSLHTTNCIAAADAAAVSVMWLPLGAANPSGSLLSHLLNDWNVIQIFGVVFILSYIKTVCGMPC
jgi:hypothetical protein